jgi:cold shock CspA family protein
MDDTQALVTGRVRWFDPALRGGVITSVDGSSYVFADEAEAEALDIGQLVTFHDAGRGRIGRIAAGVRPTDRARAFPRWRRVRRAQM